MSILEKKLNIINSLRVNVISRIRALYAVVSRNLYFNNVSFETEFLKNSKNKTFKLILPSIEKMENHDLIFDIFYVVAVTLTNNKNFLKKILQNLYIILS